MENVESERTQGFDLTISHKNRINDFSYSASFNMNIARTMHRTVDKPAARSSYDRWKNGYTNRWNDLVWGFDKVGQFQNYEEILHGLFIATIEEIRSCCRVIISMMIITVMV